MKIKYPTFCKTTEDKDAYRLAHKNNWHSYVHSIADIRAIQNGCYFDLAAALKVEQFLLLLRHSKGEFAGLPFTLQPFQRDRIIYPLYGWKRPDGTRRYRRGLIFIAKKNGKSALASGLSLYHLVADDEPGAEVYNAAVDRSNAMNVFNESMNMVKSSPVLKKRLEKKHLEILEGIKRINYRKTASWYQTLSADAATAEGKNISFLCYDEIHAAFGRDLFRALMGGGVGRRQPLMLCITTAGQQAEGSLCFEEYTHAKQVLSGEVTDESYFAFVAEGDPKLDPGDEKNWKLANPGLGVSPKTEALRDLWNNAQGNPEKINDFKQYHLNMFVQRASSAIPLDVWDKGNEPFDPDELIGQECYGGLDLGAVSDLTAFTLVFPQQDGSKKVIAYFWCPEDRAKDRDKKKVSYLKWLEDGWMTATEGNVTDYRVVRQDINQIAAKYNIKSLGVDYLYQGLQLVTDLTEDGLPVVSYRNGVMSMAPPTRQFMELVFGGRLHHGGNPVLRWMAGNLAMKKDAQGNLMPDKAKSHEKIDGITSTIMALGVSSIPDPNAPKRSVYEDRDLLILGEDEEPFEEEKSAEITTPRPRYIPSGFVVRQ